jgi:hypothetical protein
MPFDTTDSRPVWCLTTDPSGERSRLVLDMTLFFFGDDGRNWIRGRLKEWDGRCCLLGAVHFVRREIGSADDRAPEYLARAIGQCRRRRTPKTIDRIVSDYNDQAGSYADIAAVIRSARTLAEADMRAAPAVSSR